MATCLTVPNLRTGYVDVCRRVRLQGDLVSPRGMATHELTDFLLTVMDPTDCLPIGVNRKLNPAIAAAEALQLIAGVSVPELMVRISPNFEKFIDNGRFWGGYGDRVRVERPGEDRLHQAGLVVRRLAADPNSRQAQIVLWRPELDLIEEKHDYPCTTSLTFTIRKGKLQLHVTMRSNDVWWGLAYDAFQFTQLQLTVAHALGLVAGPYFHHAVSMHAYERDWSDIDQLQYPKTADRPDIPFGIRTYDASQSPWSHLEEEAARVLSGGQGDQHPWWVEQMRKYI